MPDTEVIVNTQDASLTSMWGFSATLTACPVCGHSFIHRSQYNPARCPNCLSDSITEKEEDFELALAPPELLINATISEANLTNAVQSFAAGIPYPPLDLRPDSIRKRLLQIFLPAWLVDSKVIANWQAEAGYDYEVVSHQEKYSDQSRGWTTTQIKETRIRWETRAGTLEREYHNVPAPAIENDSEIQRKLSRFDQSTATGFHPEQIPNECMIQVPDRDQSDAWPDAMLGFQNRAAEETRRACKANHLRQFRWQPEFPDVHWSFLLRPVFSSYYLDDEGKPHHILIHGQTGKTYGKRRASMRRAQATATNIVIAAAAIFFLTLLIGSASVLFPPLLIIAGFFLIGAILVGLAALFPIIQVWRFNR